MEHEAVGVLAHQGVDALLVARGAQRGHHQRLRLAAREQRGAVRARQHAGANRDRPHGARVAPVDARLAGENLVADDLGFQLEDEILDLVGVAGRRVGRDAFGFDLGDDFLQALLPRLLLAQLIGFAQQRLGQRADGRHHRLVLGGGCPVPQRLAGLFDQRVDRLDHRLLLLVAEDHGAQHDFLRKLIGFGLDHQHGCFGAGDDEVQLRRRKFGLGRIQHVLAVDVGNARRADGAVERQAGNGQRRRGADHRGDVRIHFRVHRHHGGDHLHFVVEAFGEQRTDRPVDQARRQRFLFRGAPFALEEPARDLARGVGLFLIVDGQRKEVLADARALGALRGDQNHGVAQADHDGAAGLAGDLAGFEGQRVGAVLDRFLDVLEHDWGSVKRQNGRGSGNERGHRGIIRRRCAVGNPRVRPVYLRKPSFSMSAR